VGVGGAGDEQCEREPGEEPTEREAPHQRRLRDPCPRRNPIASVAAPAFYV